MHGMTILATGTTGTTMTDAVTSLMGVATSVLDMVTGNATLMVFFCGGLVFMGIGVVKRLRG